MAKKVINSAFVLSSKFVASRQVSASKIATSHIRQPLSLSVKANRTNSTFGFSDTRANAQKTKRAIFFQRSDRRTERNSNIFYIEKRDIGK